MTTFSFHQEETCEGIIRHLESREGIGRHGVQVRDKDDTTPREARVEMTFRLGNQLYAIEHTGIEPFEGFIEMQNRAKILYAPLETQIAESLADFLKPGVVLEMQIPADAFDNFKLPQVRAVQNALVEYVRVTAPNLPARKYADFRGLPVEARPLNVPFPVTLVRFDGFGNVAGRFQLRHIAKASEQPRELRIQRTCDAKFPKLEFWKRTENARTILVLEDNDIQLTNAGVVSDAFLPIASARSDTPDETYMVSTCMTPWVAWPILVNGQSYYDLSAISHPIHFEMTERGHLI